MNPKESIGKRPELKILKVINSLAMLFATVALPIVTNPVSGNEKFPAPQRIHVPNYNSDSSSAAKIFGYKSQS